IDVGGVPAATVGDGDEAAVQPGGAPALAVADGGVPAAGPGSGAALEADGLRARPAAGAEHGGDRHDGQPRTAPGVNFPHVSPCFPEGLKDACDATSHSCLWRQPQACVRWVYYSPTWG